MNKTRLIPVDIQLTLKHLEMIFYPTCDKKEKEPQRQMNFSLAKQPVWHLSSYKQQLQNHHDLLQEVALTAEIWQRQTDKSNAELLITSKYFKITKKKTAFFRDIHPGTF